MLCYDIYFILVTINQDQMNCDFKNFLSRKTKSALRKIAIETSVTLLQH